MMIAKSVSLIVCFAGLLVSCGPPECDANVTDITAINADLLDNSVNTLRNWTPGTPLAANALAVRFTVRDTIVTLGGCGFFGNPRQSVTTLTVLALPIGQPNPIPLSVVNQLYVEQYQQLPVPLTDYLRTNTRPFYPSIVLVCYGELPVYGRQRWLMEATLYDSRKLSVTTSEINLTR
jgi:hypothetical protein